HAGCVVTTQPNPQQAGGRGGGISKRPEPRLRARLSRNSGQNAAGESKIRMVEHVEELPFQPQLNVISQRKRLGQVKVTPEEIGSPQRVAPRGSELAIRGTVTARASSGAGV